MGGINPHKRMAYAPADSARRSCRVSILIREWLIYGSHFGPFVPHVSILIREWLMDPGFNWDVDPERINPHKRMAYSTRIEMFSG